MVCWASGKAESFCNDVEGAKLISNNDTSSEEGEDASPVKLLLIENAAKELSEFKLSGLDEDEVESMRVQFGWNEFTTEEQPLYCKLLNSFKDPLILMIIASAIISAATEQYRDAIGITIAIVIVTLVGFVQEWRSDKTLQALNNMVPYKTQCLRNGEMIDLETRELVPGDFVEIGLGDRIPADIRLVECAGLELDESSITGEAIPCPKTFAPVYAMKEESELSNMVMTGTLVCNGHGKGVVVGTGYNTQFGEVFKLMESEETPKTPLQENIYSLTKFFTINTLVVIAVIMTIGLVKGLTFQYMMSLSVSLAVAALPEGLPIVVTVTLALGVVRMGKKEAMVKNLPAVETLGCVNVLCVDKTGTLTKNEMTVTVVTTGNGQDYKLTGTGYFEPGHLFSENKLTKQCPEDLELLATVGYLCNNSHVTEDKMFGNPTEAALIVLASKLNMKLPQSNRIEEVPFSHERKWMSVKCLCNIQGHTGAYYMIKGATENIIRMCTKVQIKHAVVDLNNIQRDVILNQIYQKEDRGMRTLSMCYGNSMNNLVYIGNVGIVDPLRNEVPGMVFDLSLNSIEMKMITGDSKNTAISIGKKLHIYTDNDTLLSGAMIDDMSDERLVGVIQKVPIIYRSSPKHKMRIVKALQKNGLIVAMTGDGVNDAVALKCADIGIAMGRGTDVCKEAAEIILVNDDISTILDAVREGKNIFSNIRNFVRYFCSISSSCLVLICLTIYWDLPPPLTPMQILWINMFMDGPPAQSLGAESMQSGILNSPPRCHKKQVIDIMLIFRVLLASGTIVVGTLCILGGREQIMVENEIDPNRNTTMTFTCFIFFSLWYSLSCRSHLKSVLQIGLMSNVMFVVVFLVALTTHLALVYLPIFQAIFETEALSAEDIGMLCGVTSIILVVDEVVKLCIRTVKTFFGKTQKPCYLLKLLLEH